jgi:Uncharacterized protein conserved in bacteria
MDELLNEHEQGERVRSWLQRNAIGLIGGIAVGLAAVLGWQWWQQRSLAADMAVAAKYDVVSRTAVTDAAKASTDLKGIPAKSPYAALAQLQIAKTQVDAGKNTEALATLRAVQTKDAMLARIVDQRMAHLLTTTGQPAEAVKLLGNRDDAASLEALGDAQSKLGQAEQARASYGKALRQLETGSPQRQVVEIKLVEAGGSVPNA